MMAGLATEYVSSPPPTAEMFKNAVHSRQDFTGGVLLLYQATTPILQETDELMTKTFQKLADEWHERTDYLSSPTRRIADLAYLTIIAMGEAVVPYILRDLRERGGDWYTALRVLGKGSPVPLDAQGDVERMNEAWFQWGRQRGYVS